MTNTLKDSVIESLNHILDKVDFYKPEFFKELYISTSREEKYLGKLKSGNVNEVRKTNRELLQEIFPSEIATFEYSKLMTVDALNRILEREDFYDEKLFKSLNFNDKGKRTSENVFAQYGQRRAVTLQPGCL